MVQVFRFKLINCLIVVKVTLVLNDGPWPQHGHTPHLGCLGSLSLNITCSLQNQFVNRNIVK